MRARMPADDAHAALMRHQIGHALGQVLAEATRGQLPHFDGAVLAGARDQVVVVRAPRDVQHGCFVTHDERHVAVHAAHLVDVHDEKGAAARRLRDDGYEFGVDAAEGRVPAGLGDAYVVVAVLLLERLAVHVAKFWVAHYFDRHFAFSVCVCVCVALCLLR